MMDSLSVLVTESKSGRKFDGLMKDGSYDLIKPVPRNLIISLNHYFRL